jgi:RHS repeat-associated protein
MNSRLPWLLLPPALTQSAPVAAAVPERALETAPRPLAQAESDEVPTPTDAPPLPSALSTPPPPADGIHAPLDEAVTAALVLPPAETTERPGVAAGIGTASLTPNGVGTQLGTLPLTVTLPTATLPALTAQAEILPADVAQQWTPSGLAFRLTISATDGVAASALTALPPISVTVDYRTLPLAIGGSYLHRLALYRVVGDQWELLPTTNDAVRRQLVAQVQPRLLAATAPPADDAPNLPDAGLPFREFMPVVANRVATASDEALFVLSATASGPEGSYKATPFTFARDYEVALATGSFQTSYAIPLPPAPAGLAPDIALQYDSGRVDGMTTTKNNQPSWVGLGWTLEAGHITRHLKSCENSVSPGDLCLIPNTYSIVLNGTSARLVQESGNLYRLQHDPRWKVELFSNGDATNPDSQREYWLVTTPDGSQYRFGNEKDPETGADQNSVFYVPVYDPTLCAGSPGLLCNKAWQWNLDRVQDTNDNVISYFYDAEVNFYKAITTTTDVQLPYVRAGNLSRVEYGRRVGVNSTGTAQVHFITEERCTPGSACTWPTHYPDTPGDLTCDGVAACDDNAPTFWSRKRLNYAETRFYNQGTSAYEAVTRIDLEYLFHTYTEPDGDVNEAKLWLSTITRKLGDGTGALPETRYTYHTMANRYDSAGAGAIGFYMPRIDRIFNEIGGVINVNYFHSHTCNLSNTAHVRRTDDCFRAWGPLSPTTYGWGYWNKWKVQQIEIYDDAIATDAPGIVTPFSGNADQVFTYAYSTPIFRYSDDPSLPDFNAACPNGASQCAKRTWNDFRGHATVTVTDSSGKTEYRFHRGMNGDRLDEAGSGTFSANITLSDATTRLDSNWLAGQTVESRRLTTGSVAKTRTVNWFTATPTAGSGDAGAYFVALQKSEATTYATTNKTTRTEYLYDTYGNVTYEQLHGDTATSADDRTVQRGYLANTTAYLVDRLAWQKLWAGIVSPGSPGVAGQEKGYSETAYDTLAYGVAPTKGNPTAQRAYWQATPSYQAYESTMAYDAYGRPTTVTDARGNSTTTAYHAFYGYASSVTNDLGHVVQTTMNPRWGVPTTVTDANNLVTTLEYDPYGRLSKVWLPSEPTSGVASYEFSYNLTARPAWTKSRQLQVKATSSYLESWQYVDELGRGLQTQTASATGGNRLITSQQYNALGQLYQSSVPYEKTGSAGSGYLAPSWSTVVQYQQHTYDELGRTTKSETRASSTILWDVVLVYDGWQQRHYDPNNTSTSNNVGRTDSHYNAFGQLTSVVEYNGASSYTTNYSYDLAGNLSGVTDHLGNVTSLSYDLLGRKTAMSDPDMGSWQYQYDAVGNLTGQRDARTFWLYLAYDDLNRLVSKRRDTAGTGPLVAEYGYDAVGQKGLLAFSKAYDNAGSTVAVETQAVTYDSRNRLTQQRWVVAGTGGGTFRSDYGYNEADQRTTLTYPGGNAAQQGEVVTSGYNAVGQLTSVTGLAGVQYVSSASYNAQGQPTQLRNDSGANGLTRKWTYSATTLRLDSSQAGTNAAFDNLHKLTYTYDSVGNVKTLVDTLNSSQRQCFGYDGLDRLTSAFTGNSGCTAYSATGTGPYNHTYAYDAIGNITSYAGNAYTYGDAAHKHAVTAAFGNSYGYDANGNQTSRTVGGVTYTFTYDRENRLTAVSGGSVSASFVYDADGNRVKGTIGGVTTVYIAGIYEYQGGATTHYYEGNALRRTGHASNNGVFYLLQDHLKSSSAVINQNGTLNGTRQYYFPFGGNRGGAFSTLTTKRFTGQYHESSLPGGEGLSYYNARWYDAKLGRFLSADGIVPGPANPQAFNRYTYVFNNPLKFVDPTGHDPVDFCGDNPLCLSIFFLARSGNMYNTEGLTADWGKLRDEVWYDQQRPTELGVWLRDDRYPNVDQVLIARKDYVQDIKSRPSYQLATGEVLSKWVAEFKGKLPDLGHSEFSTQRYTLKEAARADRYNAVEWYLGSHTYQFTVIGVNSLERTATVRVKVINYSGWESATREPGSFAPFTGTSVLPNRGGRPTENSLFSYGFIRTFSIFFPAWANKGTTYRQTFIWNTTMSLPYSEPMRGPR